jgi:hypothetical protein
VSSSAGDDVFDWIAEDSHALRTYHWLMLGLSLAVIVAALLLRVRDDQRVEFVFTPGQPWPELCWTKLRLGIDCPGCGLTRCFVHALHGDLSRAAAVNPAALLLVLLTVVQVPYRLWSLRHPDGIVWSTRDLVLILALPPVLLYGQWAFKMLWRVAAE